MLYFRIDFDGSRISRCVVAGVLFLLWAVCVEGVLMAQPTSLTINSRHRLSIGGASSSLDRAKFFTHAGTLFPPSSTSSNSEMKNLRLEIYSVTGLNLTPGRAATEFDQFIADGIPEDPNRPGFADPTALQNELQGSYRNFVTSGTRYESIRNSVTRPIFVNSGRSSTAYFDPAFRTGEQSTLFPNRNFYADFLRTYLREVVYGPNAFFPVTADRFHIEIINEPDLHVAGIFSGPSAASTLLASSEELALYHQEIAQMIKAEFPSASIGGPSLAVTDFAGNDYLRWNSTIKPFIDIAGSDLDYYSIHPYERYDVQSNGTVRRAVDQSPGRITSQIDMMLNRQEQIHGNRLPLSMTEYSSFNRGVNGSTANGSYAGYDRDVQQWDQSRNIREQLLLYINRPDAILNAVPFISPRHWRSDAPNRDSDDNVLYEQIVGGEFVETIIAKTMRMYAPVKGEYINVHGSNGDLQATAFRDGGKIYLLLNNLLDTPQPLDLNLLLSDLGTVNSAVISRVFRDSTAGNQFVENQEITNTFENLTLNAKEGAVITFDIGNAGGFSQTLLEDTFYGDRIAVDLNDGLLGQSPEITIDAATSEAIAAKLRVGYSRSVGVDAFTVSINGNTLSVPAKIQGIDDEEFGLIDDGLISREITVPLSYLNDGANLLRFNFTGGGYLSSTALVVTTAVAEPGSAPIIVGDCNENGEVNFLDIAAFIEVLTSGVYLTQADCNQDGVVSFLDIAAFIGILNGQ